MHLALPTEEDLRCRLLLPYLSSLGIGPDQVRLEYSFKLRLGAHTTVVSSSRSPDTVRGRLDVLVTNASGESLFVVEVKSESAALTEDDRDQGISYARLLPQIAPFVLVTNGRDAHLYDTITTRELTADVALSSRWGDWRAGHVLASTDDIRLRYEALRYFVGYSPENVRHFCRAQQDTRMRALRSGPGERERKYLPDVYTFRAEVREAIEGFLKSDATCFVLAGESGTGKTNEMCALAETLLDDHLVLFFNGSELYGALAERVADEFNWHFADELSLVRIVDRLVELAERAGRPAILLIDAIDEADVAQMPLAIGDLANRLGGRGAAVRLIVSLKTSEWSRFAELRGNHSPLADATWQPALGNDGKPSKHVGDTAEASSRDSVAAPRKPTPSFVLGRFTPEEQVSALERYRRTFSMSVSLGQELIAGMAEPLFMRMVSEVYADGAQGRTGGAAVADVISRYLNAKFAKLVDPERAHREMVAVANVILDRQPLVEPEMAWEAAPIPSPLAPEDEVRRLLNLSGTDSFGSELISHGILLALGEAGRTRRFAFVYERLRDHVIAMYLLRFGTMSAEALTAGIPDLLRRPLSAHLLAIHLRTAGAEQWNAIHRFVDRPRHFDRYLNCGFHMAAGFEVLFCHLLTSVTAVGELPAECPITSRHRTVTRSWHGLSRCSSSVC